MQATTAASSNTPRTCMGPPLCRVGGRTAGARGRRAPGLRQDLCHRGWWLCAIRILVSRFVPDLTARGAAGVSCRAAPDRRMMAAPAESGRGRVRVGRYAGTGSYRYEVVRGWPKVEIRGVAADVACDSRGRAYVAVRDPLPDGRPARSSRTPGACWCWTRMADC